MIYSLAITIVAGVLLLAFFVAVALLARQVARGEGVGLRDGWRWYPSPLALFVLVPIVAFLLVRAAPLVLAIPLVIPVVWRSRWLAGPLLYVWNLGRKRYGGDGDTDLDSQVRPSGDR